MTEQTMELKMSIKTDEATLRQIQNKLGILDDTSRDLTKALEVIVQQTFVAAGISEDFKVELHLGQVKRDFGKSGGGLNAEEWLESS